MNELILSLSDFLKKDTIEVKIDKYKGSINYCKYDISVVFKADKVSDNDIHIQGDIKGLIYLECSRCLCVYGYNTEIAVNANMNVFDGKADVNEEVRQLLLLEMPDKPLCGKDCLGICKVCGRCNKENDSCYCYDGYDNIVKERWKDILNIGGSKSAKSKKKTYPSS
ncbi:MAG: hypothetical protein LBT07_02705 [Endomicrobium sp.]|jgi:uncharacterized protein|nr:hypothetical protein [Endomicrobium sp.]